MAIDLLDLLDRHKIRSETHEHPPVLTVDAARAHWASIPATHTKNLLLKDAAGIFWLIAMSAEKPLDLKSLPSKIGSKRLRFAPSDALPELIGVETGAVSAFAIVNDRAGRVRLVIDAELMAAERVAFHPLDNRRTTVLTPEDLRRFLTAIGREALVADL